MISSMLLLSLFGGAVVGSTSSVHQDVLKLSAKTALWDSATVASKGSPEGYFIADAFYGSTDCSTGDNVRFGTGTGVCFTGYVNDKPVGSTMYKYSPSSTESLLKFDHSVYDSLDCSGNAQTDPLYVPSSCIDTGSSGAPGSAVYTYTTASAPWSKYEPGLMFQYYDTSAHCSNGGVGGSFYWTKLNSCLPNSGGGSSSFTSCENDLFSLTQYNDTACTEFNVETTQQLQQCVVNEPSGSDMELNNYRTMMCN